VLVADGLTGRSIPYAVEVAVEEACELGGWILIATALVAEMVLQLLALGRRSSPGRGSAHRPAAGRRPAARAARAHAR
jgi:hypothetical protein